MKNIFSYLILLLALVATGCASNVGAETTVDFGSQVADTTKGSLGIPRVNGHEQQTEISTIVGNTSTSMPVATSESIATTTVGKNVPTVDVVESSNTTTLNSIDGRPLSQGWIESVSLRKNLGLLENARVQEEYWLNNPNTLSSPMGAFCWAYHEIYRSMWRLLSFDILSSEIEWLMTKLDIKVTQVGEEGPDRNTAVLDILAEGDNQDTAPVGNIEGSDAQTNTIEPGQDRTIVGLEGNRLEGFQTIEPSQDRTDEELARLLFYSDEYIESYRIENRIAGDGTEWYDALRAVADPKVIEATRSGDGLPTLVRPFADRFFETVNQLAIDTRPATNDYYAGDSFDAFSEEIPLPSDLVGFLEEAKYSQDCKRALLTILDYE